MVYRLWYKIIRNER